MAKTLLTLDDVLVRYGGVTALKIPFLSVDTGEILALIGPNGAGKSTLIRIIALLQRPAAGVVRFEGSEHPWEERFKIRRRIAVVFQSPLLLKGTVYDNVAAGLKLRGFERESIQKRVRPWLERLNIARLADQQIQKISGGEAQRTSLARAFVLNPELLLLDEPFSPLDSTTRERLLSDLQEILKETGTTTVLVTHHRDEAFMLANRVGVLDGGQLLQIGGVDDVFMHPVSDRVAEIAGVENRIPGVVRETGEPLSIVDIGSYLVRVPGEWQRGSRVIVLVRADDLRLRSCEWSGLSESANCLKARIVSISSRIVTDRVALQAGQHRLIANVRRNESIPLREGDAVQVTFLPDAVHVVAETA